MATVYEITPTDRIVGNTKSTRSGFRHVVEYHRDGVILASKSVSYTNRTWESFEYETAISGLLEKMRLPDDEKKSTLSICEDAANGKTDTMFKSVAAVALMGDIFGQTKKEKNDWKARMLKAGLGSSGLEMPADWDTLAEDEKERRLNNVLSACKGGA